jgi:hypothetical protein
VSAVLTALPTLRPSVADDAELSTRGPTREEDSPERRALVREGRRAARHLSIARKIADAHGEEI